MKKLFSGKRLLLTCVLVVVLGLGAYHRYMVWRFADAYDAYASLAARHEEAAEIPMLPDNPLRRDLNQALTDVLTPDVSNERRLERAREGLALLVLAEGHIDAVGEVSEDVTKALLAMEEEASIAALTGFGIEKNIIDLAHRRLNIIADIRGLSYRANHDTKTIFDRVLADGGALTSAHSASLDRLLPEVEEQFNRRSNLYLELDDVGARIRAAHSDFTRVW